MCKVTIKQQGRITTVSIPEGHNDVGKFLRSLSVWDSYDRDTHNYEYQIDGGIGSSIGNILKGAFANIEMTMA